MASSQHMLTRVRRPRIHITYDLETGGAFQTRELPFVVGVLGDFSGDSTEPKRPLSERKFIQVDGSNFDDVMAKIAPGVNCRVKNTIADDDSEIPVQLKFNSMGDFEPAAIVDQVEPLRKLMEARNHLRDLISKIDRSEELDEVLTRCLTDESNLQEVSSSLGDVSSTPDADE